MHREKSGFTLVELLVMIENTYEFFPWTSKGNYAVCWGNDGYLDFDPFQPLSQEIKQKRGAFHIVMLPGWKDAPQEDLRQENLGPWKLGHGLGTKLGSLLDGSSNTLMVGEVIGFDSPEDARGARVFSRHGLCGFLSQISSRRRTDRRDSDV